jgi:predicted N-acetyltransferase YhbS
MAIQAGGHPRRLPALRREPLQSLFNVLALSPQGADPTAVTEEELSAWVESVGEQDMRGVSPIYDLNTLVGNGQNGNKSRACYRPPMPLATEHSTHLTARLLAWQSKGMLRQATNLDVPRIRTLMETLGGFWQSWWSDKTLIDAIQSAEGLAFVWEDDRRILGFVCAHDFGFRAYLNELIVDTGVRNKGIGTRLVLAVEEALRNRHQRILIADVWHDTEVFYRSLGWEPPKAVLLRQQLESQY